ncbi:MAG: exonuclease subunit SbcD [Acidobacteria bacterium]|nr:exonuclease subunit SbcD [Acidobacteriota bacterium]
MRILHTSDWHLGRDFGPVSLHDDQKAFLEWLVGQVRKLQIDLVVIAGDLFDRAYAPADAIRLFRDALHELLGTGAKVAAITGNHDAHDRVANYGGLLDLSGLYLRGGYQAVGEVIQVPFSDGPLDLVLLPFLDPQSAPDSLGVETVPTEDGAVAEGVDDAFARRVRRTHQSVLEDAVKAVQPRLTALRSLAVAHAFVSGGEVSESERQLEVGGTGSVSADVFSPFSYTALGHLHRPQSIDGAPNVRYSGTPLAYSYSEEHPKSVTIIDMASDGGCTYETVPVGVGRAVATVTGRIDELLAMKPTEAVRASFVRAIITDPGVVLDAKQRLSVVFPNVVDIEMRPVGADGEPIVPSGVLVDRKRLTPAEIADQFWVDSVGTLPSGRQQRMVHSALHDAEGQVA